MLSNLLPPRIDRRHLLQAAIAAPLACRFAATRERTSLAHAVTPPGLDLAAMVFVGDERPDGFSPPFSQGYRPGDPTRDDLDQTRLGVMRGFTASYLTVGDSGIDSPLYQVTLHLAAFATEAQAGAGLDTLADPNRRFIDPVVTATSWPAPSLDAGPTRLTLIVTDYRAQDGPVVQSHDLLVQIGQIVAGVKIDRYFNADDPAIATLIATAVATPQAVNTEAVTLASDIAQRFATRIGNVLAGIAPDGIDFAWPSRLVPIDQMWPEAWERTRFVFEGYRTIADLVGGNGSLSDFALDFRGGYFRTTAIGDLPDDKMPPAVTVALMAFHSSADATNVFNGIKTAPNDLPLPATEASHARQLVAAPTLTGVDAALAYTAPYTEFGPVNSAGIVVVIGETLISIDIQGVRNADDALAAATELASAQVSCVTDVVTACAATPIPSTISDLWFPGSE